MKIKFKKELVTAICALTCLSANADLLWKIENGLNEYKNENYFFARDYFIDYIKTNPNDKDGYFWLAKTYQNLNDDKKARENFKKSYELMAKEGNIKKIDFSKKLSGNTEDYFDMATMYLDSGNINQAETYTNMMLKIDSKSASAYFVKAKIELLRKNGKKALEYMNLAIMYNNDLLYTNLAKSLGITSIPPMTKDLYLSNAVDFYFDGDITHAISSLENAFEDKKDIDLMNFLAFLYIKNNNITAAQDVLNESLKLEENNVQALLLKARLAKIQKDKSKEVDYLLKAYKLNPNHQDTLNMLGNYYLEKKDFQNAQKYFEILTNINDALYEGYFGYVYSLIELGKIDDALNLMRKMTVLNPTSSEIQYLLAKICYLRGDYKEASGYINDVLDHVQNPNYYLLAAQINYDMRKFAISISYLNDVLKMPYAPFEIDEVSDYYIKNLIALKDLNSLQIYLSESNTLDKNRLLYKYYLYIMYKLEGSKEKADTLYAQIKKAKPDTITNYLDLSEILFREEGSAAAIKMLDTGLKKYPDGAQLYFKKIKIYSSLNSKDKKQEVISAMRKAT